MSAKAGNSPRILITRLSHIGDCVLTLPLVCAIKRAYPDSFISWAVESPTHKLLGDHPCIDKMIVVPKGLAKNPFKWAAVSKQFRELKIDLAIDPQSLTKSSLIGRLSGASTRLGFAPPYRREFSKYLNNEFVETKHEHLVDRTLDFLGHPSLNVSDRGVEFRLLTKERDRTTIGDFLKANRLPSFLAINPGGSWESKLWLPKRFGFVARYAFHSFALRTVVSWAGPEERQMAEEIVESSDGHAILAPSTTLGELAALYQRAAAFIGCDTGPLHIASAVGAKCVGLHGPTLPQKSGAYGDQHVAVQRWYQGARHRKRASNMAMRDITVDDVCVALDQLFATRSNRLAA